MKVKEESDKAGLKLNIQKIKIMTSRPITSWQVDGQTMETVTDIIFFGSKITADGDWSHEIKRYMLLGRKAMTNLDSILKSRDITLPTGSINQSYGFSSSHVWIWELDHKEGWVPKNWCFCTMVLEKILESPLDCKEIQAINPKGNKSWIFIGRIDAEAEALILWPPDAKNRLIRKDPDAGEDGRQEEKAMKEGEMVGWHHGLNGHTFEQTLGDGEGQGSLALWSMGLQRIRFDWATEQQQQSTSLIIWGGKYKQQTPTEMIMYKKVKCSTLTDQSCYCYCCCC